jgi:hypothetical protein
MPALYHGRIGRRNPKAGMATAAKVFRGYSLTAGMRLNIPEFPPPPRGGTRPTTGNLPVLSGACVEYR